GVEDALIATMSPQERQFFYRSLLAELGGVVVLDNAKDAVQVEPLLPGQGGCRVLVTSRESLGLHGVQPLRLETMEPGEALQLLVLVSGRGMPDAAELVAAAEVVALCGELPLALRISGAILCKRQQWSWQRLAMELRDERQRLEQFAILHHIIKPAGDLDVRSSFNVSFGLLSEAEKQIFKQVCAIPGIDFGAGVAAAVAEQEDTTAILGLLDRLADVQLLDGMPAERYRLHDLVRLFGQETLEQERELGLRAVQWYRMIADFADDCLKEQLGAEREATVQREQETILQTRQRLLDQSHRWFATEWENLKASVAWCNARQVWSEGSQLPRWMDYYAALQGCRADMPALLQMGLNAAKQSDDRLGEANTLQAIGDVLQFLDQRQDALQRYETAIAIYREVGARLGEANTLKAIGDVLQFLKQSQDALQRYETAIAIYREVGDRLGEANTLQAIGDCETDTEKALTYFQTALQSYIDIGDKYSQARILVVSIAEAYIKLQQPQLALQSLQQAHQLFSEIDFAQGVEIVDSQIDRLQNPTATQSQISHNRRSLSLRSLFKNPWFWFAVGMGIVFLVWRLTQH
ncbi:MAG: tetratricopeptide repeat protein, partial [Thermosynechococcaceae cyanobacterium]